MQRRQGSWMFCLLVGLGLLIFYQQDLQAKPGDLDKDFGTEGTGVVKTSTPYNIPKSVISLPNGDFIVGGRSGLVRFKADGKIDGSFAPNNGGLTKFGSAENDRLQAFALQPDGKIVATGRVNTIFPDKTVTLEEMAKIVEKLLNKKTSEDSWKKITIKDLKDTNFYDKKMLEGMENSLESFNKQYPDPNKPTWEWDKVTVGEILADGVNIQTGPMELVNMAEFVEKMQGKKPSGGSWKAITLKDLKDNGFYDEKLMEPKAQEAMKYFNKKWVEVTVNDLYLMGYSGYSSDIGLIRYNTDGSIDNTFGTNGMVVTNLADSDYAHAMVIQADGKILVGAQTSGLKKYSFPILRYNSDGLLDTSFGIDQTGIVTTSFGVACCVAVDFVPPTEVHSLTTQPDGKILAGGIYFDSYSDPVAYKPVLVRLLENGFPDTSFGENGRVKLNTNFSGTSGDNYVLQSDGKIVAALTEYKEDKDKKDGYDTKLALIRLNANGSLDNSFGPNPPGKPDSGNPEALLQTNGALHLSQQSDGKFVVSTYYDLLRLNADGTLDTNFGSGGKVMLQDETKETGINVPNSFLFFAQSHALLPDGNLLVLGNASYNDAQTYYPNATVLEKYLTYDCNQNPLWYLDNDQDGYGDSKNGKGCENDKPPLGYVTNNLDCNDAASKINPQMMEVCGDQVDNNCNSKTDDQEHLWYSDKDKDGYGDAKATGQASCTAPAGLVSNNLDCGDNKAAVNQVVQFYPDEDSDGYGVLEGKTTGNKPVEGCMPKPAGYVAMLGDCDDANKDVSPGAKEICDTKDNNCDEKIDNVTGPCKTELKGICSEGQNECKNGQQVCTQKLKPSSEACNNLDDDCDGTVDNNLGANFKYSYYWDKDGDSYPGGEAVYSCNPKPDGAVYGGTKDCDDNNKDIKPGAPEKCNGIDDNCNTQIDDGVTEVGKACPATGFLGICSIGAWKCSGKEGLKCNPLLKPGEKKEVCDSNNQDEDCDGKINDADEDAIGKDNFYPDQDGDGFGDKNSLPQSLCKNPSTKDKKFSKNKTDCDDSNSTINPNMEEVCNGKDNDCDGKIDTQDPSAGQACPTGLPNKCAEGKKVCLQSKLQCIPVSSGVPELCNQLDDDCDSKIDDADDNVQGFTWYLDADGDGYSAIDSPSVKACKNPSKPGKKYVSTKGGDCNDTNPKISPKAMEICVNGIDEDCSGTPDDDC